MEGYTFRLKRPKYYQTSDTHTLHPISPGVLDPGNTPEGGGANRVKKIIEKTSMITFKYTWNPVETTLKPLLYLNYFPSLGFNHLNYFP